MSEIQLLKLVKKSIPNRRGDKFDDVYIFHPNRLEIVDLNSMVVNGTSKFINYDKVDFNYTLDYAKYHICLNVDGINYDFEGNLMEIVNLKSSDIVLKNLVNDTFVEIKKIIDSFKK